MASCRTSNIPWWMSTLGPYIFTAISLRISIWTSRPTIDKVDILGPKLYKLSAYKHVYVICNLKQTSSTHPICNTRALLERSVESSAMPFFFETSVCSQGESLDNQTLSNADFHIPSPHAISVSQITRLEGHQHYDSLDTSRVMHSIQHKQL